jgi:hypothetical protein
MDPKLMKWGSLAVLLFVLVVAIVTGNSGLWALTAISAGATLLAWRRGTRA